MEWLTVGPLTIPVDETASALIPFRGEKFSFRYISLADVINDRIPAGSLKGKIAIVGTTAPGLLDQRSTPVGSVYPGVEIHANLIAGMLDRTMKQKPSFMVGAEVVLLLIGGITLALLMPILSPLRAMLVSIVAMGLIISLNLVVWTEGGLVLPLASSLLMTIALFTINMAYGYFVESRSKRQFTELFGQYVPPELVDKMAADPEKYSMEGRSEQLTVLFSDIVGFTSISEALNPKDLSAFINEYLTSMSLVIRDHRGTLDKYIGDAIMAFWGAPVADTEHARQGVLAALAMQARLLEINELIRSRGWPPIRIGIGVNSGMMSVGDMGSKIRRAYTVMGDAVNLGSRLEGADARLRGGRHRGPGNPGSCQGRRFSRAGQGQGQRQGRTGRDIRGGGDRRSGQRRAAGRNQALAPVPQAVSRAGVGPGRAVPAEPDAHESRAQAVQGILGAPGEHAV